ncbi:serine hydrolase domain-containing protein [Microbacterium sp. NPDC056569]|uniref:serine hydrolase domain-containing protein n=1 Tax=Microbacterium sp. NPDC056569 TaxID=3345867 RepID=UPI00366AD566
MTHLLPRSTPERQSVRSAAISRLIAALDGISHIHTLTVVRHGHVVAEATWAPYEREVPTAMYSVSKSFTSIAVGLAVADGLLTVDDRVVDLLPDMVPEQPSGHLAALRVRHLLTMTTGHVVEPPLEDADWARAALDAELTREPGTHWMYNTPATHLLSQVLQRLTGQRLVDYLAPRLFEPLGFRRPEWRQSPTGVDAGGFGLSIRPEELAVFGQLLLQRGRWEGRQLVPAAWIDAATSRQVANDPGDGDWNQGYGYQFWRCRHDAYRGDGAFGQYVVVLPEFDAVVAITGGLPDMQEPLDAIWDALLPAFDTDAAPEDVVAATPIAAIDGGSRHAAVAHEYEGPLRAIRVEDGLLAIDGWELPWVPGSWSIGAFPPDPTADRLWYGDRVAVSGGWSGETFRADLRLLGDATTFHLQLEASGHLRITRDVGFDGTDVWEGEPRNQPAVVAHHIAVSP